VLLSIWTASAAHVASAQEPGTGFEAGLRVGFALPLGDALGGVGGGEDGNDLDRVIEGAIPIWVDLGYRVLPELFVGLYGQYGFGFSGTDRCDGSAEADCPSSTMRLGLQLHYHPLLESGANPWVGLGFGYEWLTFGVESGQDAISFTLRGFELLNLQAGLDFEVTESFHLGPAISFSLGQYSEASSDCSGYFVDQCMVPEFEAALHEWLMLGVRGAYAP
jgi:hypothetical protein